MSLAGCAGRSWWALPAPCRAAQTARQLGRKEGRRSIISECVGFRRMKIIINQLNEELRAAQLWRPIYA